MADAEEPTTEVNETVQDTTAIEETAEPTEQEAAAPVEEQAAAPVEEQAAAPVEEQAAAPVEEQVKVQEEVSTVVKKTSTKTVTKTVQSKKTEQTQESSNEKDTGVELDHVPVDLDGGWKSSTLMKATQSRIVDMRELEDRKSRVKPEEDPYWEQRNPKLYERKSKMYPEVSSRLDKTTTAYEAGKRSKAVLDPHVPPPPTGSPRKQGDVINCKTKPIQLDSPLLKPTPAVLQSSWHGKSDKLSIDRPDNAFVKSPKLITKLKGTGPQNVQSKWPEETIESVTNRWRTKDEIALEEKKFQEAKKGSTKPVLPNKHSVPSRVFHPTAAVKAHSIPKASPPAIDPREAGFNLVWNTANPNLIPEVDLGVPYKGRLSGKDSNRSSNRSSPISKFPKNLASEQSKLDSSELVKKQSFNKGMPPAPPADETGAEEEKSLTVMGEEVENIAPEE